MSALGWTPITEDQLPFDPTKGEFDVTISTGPSYQSQRDQANDFAKTLVGEMGNLLPIIGPQRAATLLSLSIKLMGTLGPVGDEIADVLSPTGSEPIPPQAQQMIAQLQAQLQQLGLKLQELQQQNQVLLFEKKAKIVEGQNQINLEKLRIEANVAEAEVNTKAQQILERTEFIHDLYTKLVQQKHEGIQQASAQAHEAALSTMESQQQSSLAAQQAAQAAAPSDEGTGQTAEQ